MSAVALLGMSTTSTLQTRTKACGGQIISPRLNGRLIFEPKAPRYREHVLKWCDFLVLVAPGGKRVRIHPGPIALLYFLCPPARTAYMVWAKVGK